MAREGSYRTRHDKRTRPVKWSPSADTEARSDKDRYFRCWNCGFICDVQRDTLGKNLRSRDGSEYYDQYYPQSTQGDRSTTTDYQLSLEGLTDSVDETSPRAGIAFARLAMLRGGAIAMESSADGTAKPIRLTYEPKTEGGCPFCGTTNYA
jgi:hypothetical protein